MTVKREDDNVVVRAITEWESGQELHRDHERREDNQKHNELKNAAVCRRLCGDAQKRPPFPTTGAIQRRDAS
jgi:hypothetical protein